MDEQIIPRIAQNGPPQNNTGKNEIIPSVKPAMAMPFDFTLICCVLPEDGGVQAAGAT